MDEATVGYLVAHPLEQTLVVARRLARRYNRVRLVGVVEPRLQQQTLRVQIQGTNKICYAY